MAVIIHKDLCKGCTKCVKDCPFEAITMQDRKAVIGIGCTSCGKCLDSCPFGAIEKTDEPEKETVDITEYHGVWVFAEQRNGVLMDVALELLGEGRRLADEIGTELSAVLLGNNVASLTDSLIAAGADRVYLADQ